MDEPIPTPVLQPAIEPEVVEGSIQIKEKRKYKNQYMLTNMSNISKTIYNIGQEAKLKGYTATGRQFHDIPAMVKLFYSTYLVGARIGEMIRDPRPVVLQVFSHKGRELIQLQRVNQKNFDKYENVGNNVKGRPIYRGVGDREIIRPQIPIDDEYDKKMWDYVFDNGININFGFLKAFPGYQNISGIEHLIPRNFKTDLTSDGIKVIKKAGIPCHLLRHLRAFNLRVNKGMDRESVIKMIGWHDEAMLDWYLAIARTMGSLQELNMMDRYFAYLDQSNVPKFKIGDSTITNITS